MKPGIRQHGPATLKLSFNMSVPARIHGGILEVTSVFTPEAERHQGHGSALLRNLCAEADEHRKVLLLMPKAYGAAGMDDSQLIEWYARFGFEAIQSNPVLMARRPGSVSFKVKPLKVALGMN